MTLTVDFGFRSQIKNITEVLFFFFLESKKCQTPSVQSRNWFGMLKDTLVNSFESIFCFYMI